MMSPEEYFRLSGEIDQLYESINIHMGGRGTKYQLTVINRILLDGPNWQELFDLPRRSGVTTGIITAVLWWVYNRPHSNILVHGNTIGAIMEQRALFRRMFLIPDIVHIRLTEESLSTRIFRFENHSRVQFCSGNLTQSGLIRGVEYDLIVTDRAFLTMEEVLHLKRSAVFKTRVVQIR